jgi:hypothetical protein
MSREDLKAIGRLLFEKISVKAHKDRTQINMQWSMVGRSSDVAGVSFADFQWMGT